MREVKRIVGPFHGKVERVDRMCLHVTIPTKDEGLIYDVKEKIYNAGFDVICYQVCDSNRPQLGVFFKC